jgi:hypothetical protein
MIDIRHDAPTTADWLMELWFVLLAIAVVATTAWVMCKAIGLAI